MKSEDLKPEQVRQLAAQIAKHNAYYQRLVSRMIQMGFPNDDPRYRGAVSVRNGIDMLRMRVDWLAKVSQPKPSPYLEHPDIPPGRRRARRQ